MQKMTKNLRFAWNNPQFRTRVALYYLWLWLFYILNTLYLILWSPILVMYFVAEWLLCKVYERGGWLLVHPVYRKAETIEYEIREEYNREENSS